MGKVKPTRKHCSEDADVDKNEVWRNVQAENSRRGAAISKLDRFSGGSKGAANNKMHHYWLGGSAAMLFGTALWALIPGRS